MPRHLLKLPKLLLANSRGMYMCIRDTGKSDAPLGDCGNLETSQHQQRNKCARFPKFLHLATLKTKRFGETPPFLQGDNINNEAILRDFLQKWQAVCRAEGLVPTRFAIFQFICLKYCACHEKVMPGHTKSCTCHAKSS